MMRNRPGAVALTAALAVLSVPGVASAEIARPPGANPSGRGYELVSLPDTGGIPMFLGLNPTSSSVMRHPALSRAGGAAFVTTELPLDGQPDSGGLSAYRSVRTASGAWSQIDANLPQRRHRFDDFAGPTDWTADITSTVWSITGREPDPTDPSPVSSQKVPIGLLLQPLGKTPREQFNGASYTEDPDNSYFPVVPSVSDDGRTVTFSKRFASFTADSPLSSVYQRTDTGPFRLVSLAPDGTPLQNATFERASSDGTKLVIGGATTAGGSSRLFVRDGSTVLQVDGGAPEPAAPRTNTRFVGASADFSTVYFVTRDRLLASDTDDDGDVYRWTRDGSGGSLQLVSRGTGGGGNGSGQGADCPANLPSTQAGDNVQGCDVAFVASSPDGQLAYFLSPERLDGAAGAEPGAANLYVRRGDGQIRYVMTVENADGVALNRAITIQPPIGDFTVEGDGSLLVRTSRDPSTGTPFATTQIVRVDPQTGSPTCISCTAGGGSASEARLTSPFDLYAGMATSNATADGQHVFFDTPARLATEDRNSGVDVYDYDVATGTRSLVSAATGGVTGSYFAGVSADGADVLFATTDSLVARDRNGPIYKVYAAHRGGGESKPSAAPAPACGDEDCKPAASAAPPAAPAPSSVPGIDRSNVRRTPAVRLSVGSVSSSARRRFARTGKLVLSLRTSAAATVRVGARARVGSRTVSVASGSVRLRRAGRSRVTLRLSSAARRELRRRGALRVRITASVSGGSATKTVTLLLRASTNQKAGAR